RGDKPHGSQVLREPDVVESDNTLSLTAAFAPLIESAVNIQVLNMQAQETFLRINSRLIESAASVVRFQTMLLEAWAPVGPNPPTPFRGGEGGVARRFLPPPSLVGRGVGGLGPTPPRALTYEQCCAFAAGEVADALGPLFAEVDSFPTRVRLPDGPLQLVDRIT